MRRKWFLMIPIGIAAIAVFTFLGGTIVKLLWNWLLPPLFGWPELTFWQALGLLALCRILFGGVGGRGGRGKWHHDNWTPEEKERFRMKMRAKWGMGEKSLETPPAQGDAGVGPAHP